MGEFRWFGVVVAVAVGGCAAGADDNTNFGTLSLSGPSSASASDDDDGGSSDEAGEGDETTAEPAGTTGSSTSDGTGTTGSDDTGGGSTGEPMGSCMVPTPCGVDPALGVVSGDTGNDTLMAMGSEPMWLHFQVTEDEDGVDGEALEVNITLTSPPMVDFDLITHRGPAGGGLDCVGISQQSTQAGTTDFLSLSWGEGIVANGFDDGSFIAVEIVPKTSVCQPGQEWTLSIVGDP